ncbi:hypothetical protein PVAP13_8NG153001 [Panicum virgatum]|uniref:Uncharacterized protein n=1 Tax=Panicum virgatum TaxID=38727 RepID=A0A8T0P3N3_PANVG|nr:hypothetical protein PVAP13_8NG153001 [Panicum virgatum]
MVIRAARPSPSTGPPWPAQYCSGPCRASPRAPLTAQARAHGPVSCLASPIWPGTTAQAGPPEAHGTPTLGNNPRSKLNNQRDLLSGPTEAQIHSLETGGKRRGRRRRRTEARRRCAGAAAEARGAGAEAAEKDKGEEAVRRCRGGEGQRRGGGAPVPWPRPEAPWPEAVRRCRGGRPRHRGRRRCASAGAEPLRRAGGGARSRPHGGGGEELRRGDGAGPTAEAWGDGTNRLPVEQAASRVAKACRRPGDRATGEWGM